MAAALRIWQQIHDQVRHQLRQGIGRDKHSTVDKSRFSVGQDNGKKGEVYGFDGGKKVKGRKRHIVVDSQGLLIGVLVTEANRRFHKLKPAHRRGSVYSYVYAYCLQGWL